MVRRDEERSTENPDEPIISLKKGPHSEPWHPRTMPPPLVYKLTVIGTKGAGKSSIVHRLVSRTYDRTYRPTRRTNQLFWRMFDENVGADALVEIEDTPGLDLASGGVPQASQIAHVDLLLKPLMWFEKLRKERDVRKTTNFSESDALLEDGTPRIAGASNRKRGKNGCGLVSKFAGFGKNGGSKKSSTTADSVMNPVAQERKRMGFIIVADVTDASSFNVAYALIDKIFDRLQVEYGCDRGSLVW